MAHIAFSFFCWNCWVGSVSMKQLCRLFAIAAFIRFDIFFVWLLAERINRMCGGRHCTFFIMWIIQVLKNYSCAASDSWNVEERNRVPKKRKNVVGKMKIKNKCLNACSSCPYVCRREDGKICSRPTSPYSQHGRFCVCQRSFFATMFILISSNGANRRNKKRHRLRDLYQFW